MRKYRWPAWDGLVADMVTRHGPAGGWFHNETILFQSLVAGVPTADRPRLLLHAYSEYRTLSEGGDLCSRSTEAACYSILISTLLPSIERPTRGQALAILAASYHQCGHGSDVEPPLTLALAHYQHRPYDEALFNAASAYRDALRKIRASSASNTRMRLLAILWHDPRRVERRCFSRQIQMSMHAMPAARRDAWHRLLRHQSLAMTAAPGAAWVRTARPLLTEVGEPEYLARLAAWSAPAVCEPGELTGAGASVWRTLVWTAHLCEQPAAALEILARLPRLAWQRHSGPSTKVMNALAWLARQHHAASPELARALSPWGGRQVELLEEALLPDQHAVRLAQREADRLRIAEAMQGMRAQLGELVGRMLHALDPAPEQQDMLDTNGDPIRSG